MDRNLTQIKTEIYDKCSLEISDFKTESESKDELDRYCDALISIRGEIARIESGEWSKDDNPMVNAPHTARSVTAADWAHPYSREVGVYPVRWLKSHKYWPSVRRVDNAFGDRNPMCLCPPMSAFDNTD